MKKIARVALPVVAGASAIIWAAAPASAHDTGRIWYGDYGYGTITQSHHTINACDMRSDSTGVHVNFRAEGGASGTVGDTNGSKPGCGSGYSSARITQFQVCAYNVGCTSWRTA